MKNLPLVNDDYLYYRTKGGPSPGLLAGVFAQQTTDNDDREEQAKFVHLF